MIPIVMLQNPLLIIAENIEERTRTEAEKRQRDEWEFHWLYYGIASLFRIGAIIQL